MNKNVVLIILGAVFASVIVALVVQSGMKKDDSGTAAPIDMTRILVANKHIAIGKRLSEEDTDWKTCPRHGVLTDSI